MGQRRLAREMALQILFEHEYGQASLPAIMDRMVTESDLQDEGKQFLLQVLQAYEDKKSEVDETLQNQSDNWKLSRMSHVDRNLLRLGVVEIRYLEDVPKSVTINEYLEIAKKFGATDSSSFINGILDKIS